MPLFARDDGAFRDVTALYAKAGGSWRRVRGGWVRVGGVWRKFLDVPLIEETVTFSASSSWVAPAGIVGVVRVVVAGPGGGGSGGVRLDMGTSSASDGSAGNGSSDFAGVVTAFPGQGGVSAKKNPSMDGLGTVPVAGVGGGYTIAGYVTAIHGSNGGSGAGGQTNASVSVPGGAGGGGGVYAGPPLVQAGAGGAGGTSPIYPWQVGNSRKWSGAGGGGGGIAVADVPVVAGQAYAVTVGLGGAGGANNGGTGGGGPGAAGANGWVTLAWSRFVI